MTGSCGPATACCERWHEIGIEADDRERERVLGQVPAESGRPDPGGPQELRCAQRVGGDDDGRALDRLACPVGRCSTTAAGDAIAADDKLAAERLRAELEPVASEHGSSDRVDACPGDTPVLSRPATGRIPTLRRSGQIGVEDFGEPAPDGGALRRFGEREVVVASSCSAAASAASSSASRDERDALRAVRSRRRAGPVRAHAADARREQRRRHPARRDRRDASPGAP